MKNIDIAAIEANYHKFKEEFNGMGYTLICNGKELSLFSINNKTTYPLSNCKVQDGSLTAQCLTDDGIINIVLGKTNLLMQLMSLDNTLLLKKVNVNINLNDRETILEGQVEVSGNNFVYSIHKKDGYYFARITGTTINEEYCTFEQSIEINSNTRQFNYLSALTNFTQLTAKSGRAYIIHSIEDGNFHYVVDDYVANRSYNPRVISDVLLTEKESMSTILAVTNSSTIKDLSYTVRDGLSKIFNFDKITLSRFLPLPINFPYTNTLSQQMIDSIDYNFKQIAIPEVAQLIKASSDMHR